MKGIIKETAKKTGASPGTLVHVGEQKLDQARISFFDYDPDRYTEEEAVALDAVLPMKSRATTSWINIDGVHDSTVIDQVGGHFGIHPLTLEDIMNTSQRPKVEAFDDYLYVVMRMLTYDADREMLQGEQVSFVLGTGFVLSFQENQGDVFFPVRERIRRAKGRIRKKKADYLLYALMDAIVDNYFTVLESMGDRVEDIEEEMLEEASQQEMASLHNIKRELVFFRRQVWHVRDFLNILEKEEDGFFEEGTRLFLRDLYDHSIQVIDIIESLREMLNSIQDLFLSQLSNKMNEVMKMLTLIATIFIPITFIAGVYGMNFEFMPELGLKWAYPVFWGVVAVMVTGMVLFFRRKKWL